MTKMRTKFVVLAIIAAVLGFYAKTSFLPKDSIIAEVTFVDVGQGDCAFVKTTSGKVILIDGGQGESFETKLQPFLKLKNIKTIDAAVFTHYHSDHIGAAGDLFKNYEVKQVVVPDYQPQSSAKKRLLESARKEGAQVLAVAEGDLLPAFEEELKIEVLHPPKGGFSSENENDNSLVLKMTYFETTFILTGDLERDGELRLVDKFDLEADVLKVGHHGSSTSSSVEFLRATDPTYGVIQCGKDNGYGHPHYETMDSLYDEDILVYRTDEDGCISFYLGEKGIESIKTNKF